MCHFILIPQQTSQLIFTNQTMAPMYQLALNGWILEGTQDRNSKDISSKDLESQNTQTECC